MGLPLPRRTRARRATYLTCVITVVIATTTSAWASPATKPATKTATIRAADTTLTCGDQVLQKATGGDWTCTFDDEFSGYSLDPTRWTAQNTATTNFTAGVECYTPNNVSVNGTALVLTATRLYRPALCGKSLYTAYQSGMVTTQNLYSQTYGRFEMRAKMPVGVGMHPAFWMIPATALTSATSYGEIDVVEAWGSYPNIVSPHLHYVTTPGNSMSGVNCQLPNTAGAFHTYALEWTATQMTFLYDGLTCWSTTWTPVWPYAPAGSTMPVPFDQPYIMMVELAVDGRAVPTNAVSPWTRLPASMTIDYIRAWK